MTKTTARGFTLIELLTVIAIIGILAAMTLAGLAGPRERAKIVTTEATMAQFRTIMTEYYTEHNTYPPIYGYKVSKHRGLSDFFFKPYMATLKLYDDKDLFDTWSESYDTNGDSIIDIGEYTPVPEKDKFGEYSYDAQVARFAGDVIGNTNQPDFEERPFLYFPVSKRQAKRVAKYYISKALAEPDPEKAIKYWNADADADKPWDFNDKNLKSLRFPPARYDTYVMISVGPEMSAHGLVPAPINPMETPDPPRYDEDAYHITALRAYYLATRDANVDDELDFDYRTRTRGDAADPNAYDGPEFINHLPDGENSGGPLIYVVD